jgi:hypothetical protein
MRLAGYDANLNSSLIFSLKLPEYFGPRSCLPGWPTARKQVPYQ